MAQALFTITLEAMKSDNGQISLQGIEFWSNVSDEEIDLHRQPCRNWMQTLSIVLLENIATFVKMSNSAAEIGDHSNRAFREGLACQLRSKFDHLSLDSRTVETC